MKNLNTLIDEWLEAHQDATLRQAIWAGAVIELRLWCRNGRDTPSAAHCAGKENTHD